MIKEEGLKMEPWEKVSSGTQSNSTILFVFVLISLLLCFAKPDVTLKGLREVKPVSSTAGPTPSILLVIPQGVLAQATHIGHVPHTLTEFVYTEI